jgi:hypothetical protein
VLWLVVTVDLFVITRHIRQGPHYQPGPDVPPYAPPNVPPYDPPDVPPDHPPDDKP